MPLDIDPSKIVDREALFQQCNWFEMPVDADGNVHIHPVDEKRPPKCRHCPCTELDRYGMQKWRVGDKEKKRQRWQCTKCKRVFIYRAGMERMRCEMKDVADMCDHFFKGHSQDSIADTLKRRQTPRHPTSVGRAIKKYVDKLEAYTSRLPLHKIGDRAHADEIYEKIGGKERLVYGMMDHQTRFLGAMDISDKKEGYDAIKLFKAWITRVQKIPVEMSTDKLPSYGEAHRAVFAPRNPLDNDSVHLADASTDLPYPDKDSTHIDNAGINKDDKKNSNIQERFNSTQRTCYRPRRGIKLEDSATFIGFKIWYNYVRYHGGIKCTPAEATGIIIHGWDKWITIIGNACIAAWEME